MNKRFPDPVLTRGQKGAFTRAWNKYLKNMGVVGSVRQLELLYENFRFGYYEKHKLFCKEEMRQIERQRRHRRKELMKIYYKGIWRPAKNLSEKMIKDVQDLIHKSISNNKSNEQPTS